MKTPCTILTRPIGIMIVITLTATSCAKLDEKFQGDLTQAQVSKDTLSAASLLQGVYNTLDFAFTSHLVVFPLTEMTTDAALMPTRGADWDDNGAWRALHQHRWTENNARVSQCFNSLNGTVYAATDALRYNLNRQQIAEARFLRAWSMYLLLDLFDQVPYRDPGESTIAPSRVRKAKTALEYIISEIEAIKNDLPDGPVGRANKWAAKFLLIKCFLNKAIYLNRISPVFDVSDMNKVISLSDEIINSNQFNFSVNYFDNFAPDNNVIGHENIFTQTDQRGPDNQLFFTFLMVYHYNQPPAGVNGAATLQDYYNKFESSDRRRGMVYPYRNAPPNPGNRINIGFLVGQQYDPFTDDPLFDVDGTVLKYTPVVKNLETGSNLRVTGIRPLKYAPDWPNLFVPENDFVYFRFSDVLLMKAEAILRGGNPTQAGIYGNSALSIVNAIRTDPARNASSLSTINLDTLLDERGRELWWEGWRRQDMIRFKKFLLPFEEKNYESNTKYLLFPIPADQVSVNPNLIQNPGY